MQEPVGHYLSRKKSRLSLSFLTLLYSWKSEQIKDDEAPFRMKDCGNLNCSRKEDAFLWKVSLFLSRHSGIIDLFKWFLIKEKFFELKRKAEPFWYTAFAIAWVPLKYIWLVYSSHSTHLWHWCASTVSALLSYSEATKMRMKNFGWPWKQKNSVEIGSLF